MNAVARAPLTFQMLTLLKKISTLFISPESVFKYTGQQMSGLDSSRGLEHLA